MTEREKMLAGELYDCGDPELLTQWHKAKDLARDYNQTDSADFDEKERILNELLGGKGKNLWITAPFYVDYGNNIYFGNNCEVNMNCTFLDDNIIRIGDNALIAPNVQIYTAFHPTNAIGKYGIDIRKEPILVYPTLHYQNGGIDISANGMSGVENLYVAGEAVGGIHGTNRLMGNSLLDIIVFGRNAGRQAGEKSKSVRLKPLTLKFVRDYEKELEDAGIRPTMPSPRLLPDYRRKDN